MSERRQLYTGSILGYFVFWGAVLLIAWWLPDLLLKLFPQWRVTSQDPWLLLPQDLTWKRILVNAATKPGIRIFFVVAGVTVGFVGSKLSQVVFVKTRLPRLLLLESAEWVMEGRRMVSLSEYGKWLQVV